MRVGKVISKSQCNLGHRRTQITTGRYVPKAVIQLN